jgi:hypothetical protein
LHCTLPSSVNDNLEKKSRVGARIGVGARIRVRVRIRIRVRVRLHSAVIASWGRRGEEISVAMSTPRS